MNTNTNISLTTLSYITITYSPITQAWHDRVRGCPLPQQSLQTCNIWDQAIYHRLSRAVLTLAYCTLFSFAKDLWMGKFHCLAK